MGRFHQWTLTNANDYEGCHTIKNAQVPHPEHHMIEEQSHQAAQANTSQAKECQKHYTQRRTQWRRFRLFR